MSIVIPGHSSPAAGFEVPLEVLSACHFRIERQCATLRRLVPHLSLASDDVEALVGLYERHIEREERELLPMAARLLSDDELELIGRAMRERRGIVVVE
jgi:hemerythrin-like domain-containing protein